MIILTDGKKTVSVEMVEWDGGSYSPDWSADFFEVGSLPKRYIDGLPGGQDCAYIVPDVDYCIDQANDCANYRGEYNDPIAQAYDEERGVEQCVIVREIDF